MCWKIRVRRSVRYDMACFTSKILRRRTKETNRASFCDGYACFARIFPACFLILVHWNSSTWVFCACESIWLRRSLKGGAIDRFIALFCHGESNISLASSPFLSKLDRQLKNHVLYLSYFCGKIFTVELKQSEPKWAYVRSLLLTGGWDERAVLIDDADAADLIHFQRSKSIQSLLQHTRS